MASVFPLKVAGLSPEKTPTGWVVRGSGAGKGVLGRFPEAMICRIVAGSDPQVVQLGLGNTTSRLCNAVYSKTLDRALVFEGEGLSIVPTVSKGRAVVITVQWTGPLVVTEYEHYIKLHRGLRWFRALDRESFPRPPAGWCSWYEYYLSITEEEIVKNTDWLAANLREYGCEWVQIDDGWQGRGEGYGSNRDFFVTCQKKFPKGMKYLAEYIKGQGFRAGIWCIPFSQSNEELFKKQPGMFIRRADGKSIGERATPADYPWMFPESERLFEWPGRYFIDPTGTEGKAYLRKLAKMLCDEWGYEYVKIDAQGGEEGILRENRRQLADQAEEAGALYREALGEIKGVMGAERFLLNCLGGWSSAGLCEGMRIGADIDLNKGWEGMRPAIESTMRWLWLNTVAFYTDPDAVCVREPLGLEAARLWTVLVGITGQLLMASDVMYKLPEERVELLRRIYPVADIHPMELYPLGTAPMPPVFDLKVNVPGVGNWDVVAVFNWQPKDKQVLELSAEKLGLEYGEIVAVDTGNGALLHRGGGGFKVEQAGGTVRVVGVWKEEGRPQFVGSSRHVTQGAVDVEVMNWDEKEGMLEGVSRVVGGDGYKVRVFVPEGWKVADERVKMKGRIGELGLGQEKSGKVKWGIKFTKV